MRIQDINAPEITKATLNLHVELSDGTVIDTDTQTSPDEVRIETDYDEDVNLVLGDDRVVRRIRYGTKVTFELFWHGDKPSIQQKISKETNGQDQ